MKIWFDKNVEAPEGYTWVRNKYDAIKLISEEESYCVTYNNELINPIELVSVPIDDDDGTELTEWLEVTGRSYPVLRHINKMTNEHKSVELYRMVSSEWTLSFIEA